jgi:hypothetical protein
MQFRGGDMKKGKRNGRKCDKEKKKRSRKT